LKRVQEENQIATETCGTRKKEQKKKDKAHCFTKRTEKKKG
jgi:hypothetical protein